MEEAQRQRGMETLLFMTYPVISTDPQLFIDRQGNPREVMADEMVNIAQNVIALPCLEMTVPYTQTAVCFVLIAKVMHGCDPR